jgi:hypothetical protein
MYDNKNSFDNNTSSGNETVNKKHSTYYQGKASDAWEYLYVLEMSGTVEKVDCPAPTRSPKLRSQMIPACAACFFEHFRKTDFICHVPEVDTTSKGHLAVLQALATLVSSRCWKG